MELRTKDVRQNLPQGVRACLCTSAVYSDLVLGINNTENHAINELFTFALHRIKYWCHV